MRSRRWCSVLAALPLALAACGGEDETPVETPAETSSPLGGQGTAPSPTQTATPSPAVSASPTPAGRTYEVQEGDTLSSIAVRFDTTVEALVDANDIPDPDRIAVGQQLTLPEG